ncbi:hypothetical protein MP478_08420 [Chryseobacterium sp. WG14]|uniref:hypothetical protein n=1 Tax=unclassified Chryseobacterium TaxID=2593645 RepID=UPI00211DCAB7|nr:MULTISPECIES: hypothetical protein [unclassified Chryseobacterium]MCQ9637636.1 hypothetical protein [Chryseobacterium sp. WG23]MCQ9639414.1 hypothetical protein [Chryseobacterium sp. WG14]
MKKYIYMTILVTSFSLTACGQVKENQKKTQSSKQQTMDLSKITDETVKNAIEALQTGDKKWYSFFTENPVMTDDGNTVDFTSFFSKALGKEHFLSIDRVENEGKDIYGSFKAGQWGTFPVFFKFHKNSEGKFERLDIGQAK